MEPLASLDIDQSQPIPDFNVVPKSNSPRITEISSDSETISEVGKENIKKKTEVETDFNQRLEKEKEEESLVQKEEKEEESLVQKEETEKSEAVSNSDVNNNNNISDKPSTDSIPENETKISLFGRISNGFKAVASKIWSVVKMIIVTPFAFVASLFIKVGEGFVKAGKGTINFAGAVLRSAKKTAVSAAQTFASAVKSVVKNRAVQCVVVIAVIAGIALNHEKIENAVRNIPKLFK